MMASAMSSSSLSSCTNEITLSGGGAAGSAGSGLTSAVTCIRVYIYI